MPDGEHMPYPVDPMTLTGEALRRWYLRSPAEIEREREVAKQRRYDDYFGGGGSTAAPEDLTNLRREQAEFGKVKQQLDKENSWFAIPALAPAAAVMGIEAGAALAGRAAASQLQKAPLSFLEREAWQIKPAAPKIARGPANTADDALRRAGRARFAQANGQSAKDMNAVVHHSSPVEYARLHPNADPNRLANLWGLPQDAHQIANNGWTAFRTAVKGTVPTQAEIMAAKLRIDKAVAPYIQRPGISRPGPRPPKGPTR